MLEFKSYNRAYIDVYQYIIYVFRKKRIFRNGGETDETLDTPVLHGIVRNTKRHKTKNLRN